MQQNEDVFDLLEKKYNDQHHKVMKMNESLREYERKLDQVDMEKGELERKISKRSEAELDEEKFRTQRQMDTVADLLRTDYHSM
ncbi:hypothetical protein OSTOST_09785 [Ostertagia ostertagi]